MTAGFLPMRSDRIPPGVLVDDFTTCNIAQRIGASATGTPSCVARSNRNASVELPSVNSVIAARAPQNLLGRWEWEWEWEWESGVCAPVSIRSGSLTTKTAIATAIAPGIAASQNTV